MGCFVLCLRTFFGRGREWVVEASCLRNIWNYIIHDQDLLSVTCWAMCGVLCAWNKCITPWVSVVSIVQWLALAASSSSVFCPSSEACVTFQIEGILWFRVSDGMDEASLPLTKPVITINAGVSLLVYGILASFTRFTRYFFKRLGILPSKEWIQFGYVLSLRRRKKAWRKAKVRNSAAFFTWLSATV